MESYGGQAAHSFGREASTFRAGELTESAEERGAPGVLRNQVRGSITPFTLVAELSSKLQLRIQDGRRSPSQCNILISWRIEQQSSVPSPQLQSSSG